MHDIFNKRIFFKMKSLTTHIKESLYSDYIKYLEANKNNLSDEAITKMRNIAVDYIDGKKLINDNMPAEWVKSLNIVLNTYHFKQKIYNYFNSKDTIGITFDDLLKNDNIIELVKSNDELFTIFNKNEEKLVNFLKDIYDIKPVTTPTTGKGEVLLALLLKNAQKEIHKITGDISIPDINISIEVKGTLGRLRAHKNAYRRPQELLNEFFEKINYNGDKTNLHIGSMVNINNLFSTLLETGKYTPEYLINTLFSVYTTQFTDNNKVIFYDKENAEYIKELQDIIDKFIKTNNKNYGEFIVRLYGVLSLIAYWKLKGFTHLLLFDDKTLDYTILKMDNITAEQIFNNDSIQFKSSPSTTSGSAEQDYTGQIKYIKR